MDWWVNTAGLILGVWGAVPTVILLRERLWGTRSMRRVLALGSQPRVEIMVTSSTTDVSKVGSPEKQKRALRSLVPSGDIAGVAELSVMLSRAYPTKSFLVTPSTMAPSNPNADNFVIGGPIHNDYARQLVESHRSTAGINAELIFDAQNRYIKFGDVEYGPDLDLLFEGNVPKLDYGIVMLTRVHRGSGTSRVLLTAGLTTYGTRAAAHFAAHQLGRYAKEHRLGRSPNVCVLVKAVLVNGEPYNLEPVAHLSGASLPTLVALQRGVIS
jgi:hypothetical protein